MTPILADASAWTPDKVIEVLMMLSAIIIGIINTLRGQTTAATNQAHGDQLKQLANNVATLSLHTPAPAQPNSQSVTTTTLPGGGMKTEIQPGIEPAPPPAPPVSLPLADIEAIAAALFKQMRAIQRPAAPSPVLSTLTTADKGIKP